MAWKIFKINGKEIFGNGEGATTGIPEPTADGSWLRSKVGSAFSWVEGYTKTALDTLFATKQDSLGYTPANKAGDTFTGNITAPNLSGSNTGDETNTTIKTKLGQATASTDGWLSSTDWDTFNSKINLSALTPYLLSSTAATTYASLTGSYSNPSWITSLAWSKITSTPTTLAGYGITDAYPLTGNPSGFLTSVPAQSFASLTGKPTTLNGYGITDGWAIGGNAITALANLGSTSNFGISFIVNNVKQIELLPIASSVAYLSLYSGTSANGAFNISVKNNNATTATRLKLITSTTANADNTYLQIDSSTGTIQFAPNGSINSQITPSGLQCPSVYGFTAPFTITAQSGNPSTTAGSGGIIFSYRNAGGTFNPTAGLYRNVQIGGVSGALQPSSTASYVGVDFLETINQTSGTGAITYINVNPTLTSNTGVVSALISNISSGTNRFNLNITGTAVNYLAGNTSIGTTTVSSLLTLGGSTTARSSLRLLAGTAPTTPNDGDIWYDGTNIYLRVGSTTKMFTTV